ncbi:uncharacterized protein [Chelonus insularis]|uniref:uncharacterized protein n=1 Tax=Chelonus insularis TaxID=460826 RepID=UPI00158CC15A|nr:uncharacterized protein LOC118073232 [Chelonus insularis]
MLNQLITFIVFYNLFNNKIVTGYGSNNYGFADGGMGSKFNLLQTADDDQPYDQEIEDMKTKLKEQSFKEALEHWTGKWMPEKDPEPTPIPVIQSQPSMGMNHRVSMGDGDPECDDGKTNLIVDWNFSPVNYTCYHEKITPSFAIDPQLYCEHIPPYYKAHHVCMRHRIEYDDDIPMYGPHRPVWPMYGEYKYLPRQRWIHSLEHGAVVMLYHPCVNPDELKQLKDLVKKCLRRHIITTYALLDEKRPFALVTWGCRLTMSYVNPSLIKRFIRTKALHGPEFIADDGKFTEGLLTKAAIVSDENDSILCPSR